MEKPPLTKTPPGIPQSCPLCPGPPQGGGCWRAPSPPALPTASAGLGCSRRGGTLLPKALGPGKPHSGHKHSLTQRDGTFSPGLSSSSETELGQAGRAASTSTLRLQQSHEQSTGEATSKGQEKPPQRTHQGVPNPSKRANRHLQPPAHQRSFPHRATCPRAGRKSIKKQQQGLKAAERTPVLRGEHNKSPAAPPPHSCPDAMP